MPWSVSPGYSYWHSPAPWDGEGRGSGHSGAGCCPPGVRRLVLPSCVAPVVVTRMKCRMCALTTAWRRTQHSEDELLLRDVGKWTTVRLGPWRRRGNTAMAARMLFGHKVEVKRGALYMTLPKDVFNILYAWTHRLPMKTQGNASKYFQGDFYSFPVSLTATPQLPCRKTEQIKGPRFAPCLYGGWDCAVKRDDGWKTVQRARYLAHNALGLLSLHAVKRAVQNPSLTSCQKSVHVRFFVCHEECGTTVPFLLFLSMGMPLSATNKPRQFEFALLNIHFFILNSSGFTTSLLHFWFASRKSQETAVSGNAAGCFRRQMCQWLLLRRAYTFTSPSIFCSYLMGFPSPPTSTVAGLHFFKNKTKATMISTVSGL